jgi:hypothetical protein
MGTETMLQKYLQMFGKLRMEKGTLDEGTLDELTGELEEDNISKTDCCGMEALRRWERLTE